MVVTALVVVSAPLIDRVDGEGDEPRVGGTRVPFWAGAQADYYRSRKQKTKQDFPPSY